MLFARFRQRRRRERVASALYLSLVSQSRQSGFYTDLGVPDCLEGRFDMIVLHGYAVMRRLGAIGGDKAEEARELSQALFDLMFADMDRNLREMGVTDLAVGRRVQRMAESFYGRVAAYDRALAAEDNELHAALARNLYQKAEPRPEHTAMMAAYLRHLLAVLDAQGQGAILEGSIHFPPAEAAQ